MLKFIKIGKSWKIPKKEKPFINVVFCDTNIHITKNKQIENEKEP